MNQTSSPRLLVRVFRPLVLAPMALAIAGFGHFLNSNSASGDALKITDIS